MQCGGRARTFRATARFPGSSLRRRFRTAPAGRRPPSRSRDGGQFHERSGARAVRLGFRSFQGSRRLNFAAPNDRTDKQSTPFRPTFMTKWLGTSKFFSVLLTFGLPRRRNSGPNKLKSLRAGRTAAVISEPKCSRGYSTKSDPVKSSTIDRREAFARRPLY